MGNVGKGGGGGKHGLTYKMRFRTVDLTTAQILNLFTTGVELVAAPGAGLIIQPIAFAISHKLNTTGFAAGGNLVVSYVGGAPTFFQTIALAGLVTFGGDNAQAGLPVSNLPISEFESNMKNKPLMLANITAAFTTGDGSLRVTTFFDLGPGI